MPEYRSLTSLARLFETPESTLRSWRDRFHPYIPHKETADTVPVGVDGVRTLSRVTVYDVERFREIKELVTVWAKQPPARSLRDVEHELQRRYPVTGETPNWTSTAINARNDRADRADHDATTAPQDLRGPHPEARGLVDGSPVLALPTEAASRFADAADAAVRALPEALGTASRLADAVEQAPSRADISAMGEVIAALTEHLAQLRDETLPLLEQRLTASLDRNAEAARELTRTNTELTRANTALVGAQADNTASIAALAKVNGELVELRRRDLARAEAPGFWARLWDGLGRSLRVVGMGTAVLGVSAAALAAHGGVHVVSQPSFSHAAQPARGPSRIEETVGPQRSEDP